MRQIDRQARFGMRFAMLATAAPQGRVPRSAPRERGAPGGTRLPLRRALDTIRLWQERVRGRKQLLQLDDRVLRDIGITRLQAEAEAHKPFWRA